jgi:hypothetical protein
MTGPQLNLYDHLCGTPPLETRPDAIEAVRVLHKAYIEGYFGETTHEVFPDIDQNTLSWRLYFTLPCSINYQRKSEGLWLAALKTFLDPETYFVFDPRNIGRGIEAYQYALTKHKLVLQPSKQTMIWYRFSESLMNYGEGDPDKLFAKFGYDVADIKDFVAFHKVEFPYVSGPKLINYWLYIYDYFVEVPFINRSSITVIPDIHVKRATVELGLIEPKHSDNIDAVAGLWDNILKGSGLAPCDLHGPLWRWSRAGFPKISMIASKIGMEV